MTFPSSIRWLTFGGNMGAQCPWGTHSGLSLQWRTLTCRYSQVSFITWRSKHQNCLLELGLPAFLSFALLIRHDYPSQITYNDLFPNSVNISQIIRVWSYIFWKHFHDYPAPAQQYFLLFFSFLLRSQISISHSEYLTRKTNSFHRCEKIYDIFLLEI